MRYYDTNKFEANVEFIEERRFQDLTSEQITELFLNETQLSYLFVADVDTFSSNEFPILTIDLNEEPGRSFRVIADDLWSVGNNLSLGNMDFSEFADASDQNGIFRGFEN